VSGWSFKQWILLGLAVFVLLVAWLIREALTPFVIAMVLVYVLNPLVEALQERSIRGHKMPRFVAVLLVLGVLIGGGVWLIAWLVPALAREIRPFTHSLTSYYGHIQEELLPRFKQFAQQVADEIGYTGDIGQRIDDAIAGSLSWDFDPSLVVDWLQQVVGDIFQLFFEGVLIFILTLFMLLDLGKISEGFWRLIPERSRPVLRHLIDALDRDLSGSIRGQLTICLINLVLTTVGMLILKVKYAITLGFIAGVFSIIPVFGAIISTVPIVIVSLTTSPLMALKAVLVIVVIHLIEANALNPNVMGHHVKLHPIVILFSLVVAEHVLGPIGLLVGVPIAAILRSIAYFAWVQLTQDSTSPHDRDGITGTEEGAPSPTDGSDSKDSKATPKGPSADGVPGPHRPDDQGADPQGLALSDG